ncbi:unnamed protein product [Lasius platythorax]|uniref:Uncharacterized protein n=1 Tax=Lasius platythorax TaxID=488582 RepID=A0AAV2NL40_9HYME
MTSFFSFLVELGEDVKEPLRARAMRIDPIDGRRNARGICHAQKYYVIYLEGQTSSGVVYDLRDRFQKTFAIYATPERAQRVTEKYERAIVSEALSPAADLFSFTNLGRSFSLYYASIVHPSPMSDGRRI